MNIIKKYPRIFLSLLILLMCLGVVFLYFNVPGESKLLPPCIFHYVTNLYCPGCGSGRVAYSLIHGDIVTALRCNILTVIFIPILAYSFLVFCVNTYSKRQLMKQINYNQVSATIIVVTIIVFGILRNIPFAPFSYLAPISLV